jgi:hypothetical protein
MAPRLGTLNGPRVDSRALGQALLRDLPGRTQLGDATSYVLHHLCGLHTPK